MREESLRAGSFGGFPEAGIAFLRDLAANNDRAWFAKHRDLYKRALEGPGKNFCAAMEAALTRRFNRPFKGKIFRLHRDLRFSHDKTPYNTHLRMAFFPQTDASPGFGFYFSLEVERVILGGGVMGFPKAALEAYRQSVAEDESGAQLERLLAALVAAGFRLDAPELKRLPSGIAKDHPREALLRRKSLTLWRDLSGHRFITDSKTIEFCADVFAELQPLNELLERGVAKQRFT